ncbi:hypothetical protein HDU98_009454 [Podochytrium sp. JEL0797]|nr:hypothetical protein HDU98_009454 [Podochytrium sp. JEL0797]
MSRVPRSNSSRSKTAGRDYDYDDAPATRSASSNRNRTDRTYDADAPRRGYADDASPEPVRFKSSSRKEYSEEKSSRRNNDEDNYRSNSRSPRDRDENSSTSRRGGDKDVPLNPYGAGDQDYNNNSRNAGGASRNQYTADEKWGSDYDAKSASSDVYRQDLEDYGYGGYPGDEPERKSNIEKYLCCCCPKNKKHRMICGGVILLILIALAIPAYFYWPRFPEIKVNSINLSNIDKGAFNFTTPGNNGNLNEMSISLSLQMFVSTYNPNRYGLNVDSIDLVAQMMVNTSYVYSPLKVQPLGSFASLGAVVSQSGPIPLASSKPPGYKPSNTSQIGTSKVDGLYFPAMAWVNYTMVFNLLYTPDKYVGLMNDPTVMEIADCCGITSRYQPAGRPMKIHYDAESTISMLKPLGYAPSVSNDIMINCPIEPCQINQVVAAVQNGQDAFAALQAILSAPQNC